MAKMAKTAQMAKSAGQGKLVFLPLGGLGEIGMNFALYGLVGQGKQDQWLAVDCGVTFGDESTPGADLIVPDTTALKGKKPLSLIITHAHEDHLGAVPYLWKELRCDVIAGGFSRSILTRKLEEHRLAIPLETTPKSKRKTIGDFDIQWIPMPHSIPEAMALYIRTPLGNVFHSGDWNTDSNPPVGNSWNQKQLADIGKQGVDVLLCDSTNVFDKTGEGSEKAVGEALKEVITTRAYVSKNPAKNSKAFQTAKDAKDSKPSKDSQPLKHFKGGTKRVAVTFFASNISRMHSVATAALECGRTPVSVGRSMGNYEAAARQNGYLKDLAKFTSANRAGGVSPAKTVYMLTGCQGEQRAALARVSKNTHPDAKLEKGDLLLFSARIIPGNEKAVKKIMNRLAQKGVEIVLPDEEPIHASGHPSRKDLQSLYGLLKPKGLVPIHGEFLHLTEQAKLAQQNSIATQVVENGERCRLLPLPLKIEGTEASGRRAVLLGELQATNSDPIKQRQKVAEDGGCSLQVVISKKKGTLLAPPTVTTFGIFTKQEDAQITQTIQKQVAKVLDKMPYEVLIRQKKVESIAASCLRREFFNRFQIKPLMRISVVYA